MRFNYGELPAHPIEAKIKRDIPEGWEAVGVIGEREVYEPTPMNKTRAEQYDDAFGVDNWGLLRKKNEDGSRSQLLDVIINRSALDEEEERSIEAQPDDVETYHIPEHDHEGEE